VIEGAAIIIMASLLGFVFGRFPGRRGSTEKIKPVCGCHRHHSFHDPQTGACLGGDSIGIHCGEPGYGHRE